MHSTLHICLLLILCNTGTCYKKEEDDAHVGQDGEGAANPKPRPKELTVAIWKGEDLTLPKDTWSNWAKRAWFSAFGKTQLPDPIIVARVGQAGSTWEQKIRGAGRVSRQDDQAIQNGEAIFNLAFTVDISQMSKPEVHIKMYDGDTIEEHFVGQHVEFLDTIIETMDKKQTKALIGELHDRKDHPVGNIHISAGEPDDMKELFFEAKATEKMHEGSAERMGHPGEEKEVKLDKIMPLHVGDTNLPRALRGVFWVKGQAALMTFGGPSRDGGGCSPGKLTGTKYKVRVAGDRTWAHVGATRSAYNEENKKEKKKQEKLDRKKQRKMNEMENLDIVYNFHFDNAEMPTKCRIFPESKTPGLRLNDESLLDFEMELMDQPRKGSVVWSRTGENNDDALVQVMDQDGSFIEPAWENFKNSETVLWGDSYKQKSLTFHEIEVPMPFAPFGKQKTCRVDEVNGTFPLIVGGEELPQQLQGLFWLSNQGVGSALVSFGGPSRDGGGCSPGWKNKKHYAIRVAGDRVWSMAESTSPHVLFNNQVDCVYNLHFDDAVNPKFCQIYPEWRTQGAELKHVEFLVDFEMTLEENGMDEYPGSWVWARQSYSFGKKLGGAFTYQFVQVMKANGAKIDAAWSAFKKYQESDEAGDSPGVLSYWEIEEPT